MYSASKAALTQASETWRLEFEPLGVRVITVVMGLVKSEFFSAYEADVKLLDNSYYTPAKPMLDKMMKPEPSFLQISAEEYAERVANDIEKGRTGKIWVGGLTTIIRFWGWLFRGWFLVSVIFFGLSLRADTFEKTFTDMEAFPFNRIIFSACEHPVLFPFFASHGRGCRWSWVIT